MAQQQDSNASEKELLFNAIRNGNTEDVERIIYKYPTLVNCQNASGFSPLAMAIREGDLIIADLLIDYGADLNFKHNGVDSCGLFALAREHNASADMCNLLQNKLADYMKPRGARTKPALRNDASSDEEDDLEAPEPEVQNSNASEKELLFNAIRNGNTEDVERIIYKYPTLVNCQNASGFSPLAMAIREGDLIIADLLIDYGADLNFKHNGVDSCGLFALAREHNASADMCNLLQNKLEDYTKPALRNDASSDKEDDLEAPEPEVSALMLIGIADEDVSHL